MFQTKVVDKINTCFYIQQVFFVNCSVYEIVWKNIVCQTGHRQQYNAVHAFCMLDEEATSAQICNTLCSSTATKATRRRLSVTLNVHCLSCSCCSFQMFASSTP
jgi:hypothetical protein